MFPESAKPNKSASDHKQPNKLLEKEVRDISRHDIADLQKLGGIGTHHHHQLQGGEDEQHRISIVKLAGTNFGANMRRELGKKSLSISHEHEHDDDEEDPAGIYVNSNFQAVNNSIMMNNSCSNNDPGFHLDISDVFDHPHSGLRPEKYSQKQTSQKKDKLAVEADQRSAAHSN